MQLSLFQSLSGMQISLKRFEKKVPMESQHMPAAFNAIIMNKSVQSPLDFIGSQLQLACAYFIVRIVLPCYYTFISDEEVL